jgi:hypothetical protein
MCLVKTLLEKNSMGKKSSEGKRVQHPFTSYIYFSPSTIQPSLRRQRPIFCISCPKVLLGSGFVKKSARLSHERIWWMFVSPFFKMIVALILQEDKPQFSCMMNLIILNKEHSLLPWLRWFSKIQNVCLNLFWYLYTQILTKTKYHHTYN